MGIVIRFSICAMRFVAAIMQPLYDQRFKIARALGVLVLCLASGVSGHAQAASGQSASAPALWNGALREALLQDVPDLLSFDPDLGQLADERTMDTETLQAYRTVQNTFSDLVFGTIITQVSVAERKTLLVRSVAKIKGRLQKPGALVVSARITKESGKRGFTIKLGTRETACTVEIYLGKKADTWLYEDIQNITFLTGSFSDELNIDRRTKLEFEGQIPYGN